MPPKVFRIKSTGNLAVELMSNDYGCILPDVERGVIPLGDDAFIGIKHEDLEEVIPQGDELLTTEWIKKVCRPGAGEKTCRYWG